MKYISFLVFFTFTLGIIGKSEARLFSADEMEQHLVLADSIGLGRSMTHPAYTLIKLYTIVSDGKTEIHGKYLFSLQNSRDREAARKTGLRILKDGYIWGINPKRQANKKEFMCAFDFVQSIVYRTDIDFISFHEKVDTDIHQTIIRDMFRIATEAIKIARDLPLDWIHSFLSITGFYGDDLFNFRINQLWSDNPIFSAQSLSSGTRLSRYLNYGEEVEDDFTYGHYSGDIIRKMSEPNGLLFYVLNSAFTALSEEGFVIRNSSELSSILCEVSSDLERPSRSSDYYRLRSRIFNYFKNFFYKHPIDMRNEQAKEGLILELEEIRSLIEEYIITSGLIFEVDGRFLHFRALDVLDEMKNLSIEILNGGYPHSLEEADKCLNRILNTTRSASLVLIKKNPSLAEEVGYICRMITEYLDMANRIIVCERNTRMRQTHSYRNYL